MASKIRKYKNEDTFAQLCVNKKTRVPWSNFSIYWSSAMGVAFPATCWKYKDPLWNIRIHANTYGFMLNNWDSWWNIGFGMQNEDSWWFLMNHDESWWNITIHDESWWLMITNEDSWSLMKVRDEREASFPLGTRVEKDMCWGQQPMGMMR